MRALWFDRGLVIFRDGDVSVEFHIRLSEVFGPLVEHQQGNRLVDGHPELVSLKSDEEYGITAELDGELRFGVLPWHGDARWLAEPPHGAILRLNVMSKTGGETGFIDMISTYERLPDLLKQHIEGLEARIQLSPVPDQIFKFDYRKLRVISSGANAQELTARPDFPPIFLPLVHVQPETGRKVLGFTPFAGQEIVGLSKAESDALVSEIASHTIDETQTYFHSYKEGDLVLWDNLRMLHCAMGIPEGEQREVWRTTLAPAQYPVGRPAEDGGFSFSQVDEPIRGKMANSTSVMTSTAFR
ncbi:MAG: TauD/TfdA family dioxygenase [Novosphingobium sp.]|nr:TauD/TfdA family dioxygenase [Novosphingobium sp.]